MHPEVDGRQLVGPRVEDTLLLFLQFLNLLVDTKHERAGLIHFVADHTEVTERLEHIDVGGLDLKATF